jgi:hypothetical protein
VGFIETAAQVKLDCEGHAALIEAIARQADPQAYAIKLVRFVPQLKDEIIDSLTFVMTFSGNGNIYDLAYMACSI